MPPRIDDTVRAAILADVAAGALSCRAIAKRHGVSPSTVSKLAAEAGPADAFERTQTQKATAAATVDQAARRAALGDAWLTLAEEAVAHTRAELDDANAAKAAVIAAVATDKHLALDKHGIDPNGLSAVDAWLAAMTGEEAT
ncbi:helix-turn-helix domain-containing protein [Embleya sp. NPDC059237]|uniref:helix-turn-helix domain-containing protein n=1 Tax=Embleya sp. NPDC059237 TaxID=3346784 RepID=UPI00368B17B6